MIVAGIRLIRRSGDAFADSSFRLVFSTKEASL